jgi:hypothetical protein
MCETKVHFKLKLFSSALNKEISEMLGVLAIRAAEAMLAPGKSATGPFWGPIADIGQEGAAAS